MPRFIRWASLPLLLALAGCGSNVKELGAAKEDATPKVDPAKQQEEYMKSFQKSGMQGAPPSVPGGGTKPN